MELNALLPELEVKRNNMEFTGLELVVGLGGVLMSLDLERQLPVWVCNQCGCVLWDGGGGGCVCAY